MAKTKYDVNQYDLLTKDISTQIKYRLKDALSYDFTRLPYRVASSIQSDMSKIAWFDGETFYYGSGVGTDINSMDGNDFKRIEKKLPNPIYRGGVSFYCISGKLDLGEVVLQGISLDEGYVEFFIDMVVGNLGRYLSPNGNELWRRHKRLTAKIENIDSFYGIKKGVFGVNEICMDMIDQNPSLAPLRVMSGIAIGNTVYGGISCEDLTDDIIPKQIVDDCKIDMPKAERLFKLICPDEDSRHNLVLATVYPYFKRNNEKFFVLKGPGGNGKGKYLTHFTALLGDKYGTVDLDGMVSSGFDRNNAISLLHGKLVVSAPEAKLKEPKFISELKRIATGEMMVARTVGGNMYSFKNNAVLFMDTNDAVELGDSDAIKRRMVGISFIDRILSWEEMDPYVEWLTRKDGACSLFLYAYFYYLDECSSQFSWKDVDVNDGDSYSSQTIEVIDKLIDSMEELGSDKAYVRAAELSAISKGEKTRFFEEFGLKTSSKRIGGSVVRAIMIEDQSIFNKKLMDRRLV